METGGPYTLVLKPGLVVHSVYNGYWFWGRPSFYDLWRDLRAAMAESRRDWDLSAPGLRESWAAGNYSPFHRWDRRLGVRGHGTRQTGPPVTAPDPGGPASLPVSVFRGR